MSDEKDLRATIQEAYDASEEQAKAAEPGPEPEKPESEKAEAETVERPRGPDGKFLPKAAAEKVADKPEAPKIPDISIETPTEPEAKAVEAPARWPVEQREKFKALPPEWQSFVAERHKEMEADYTRKTMEIAELRRDAEPIMQIFAPYRDMIATAGLTPARVVQRWAAAEQWLQRDPAAAISHLAKSYGIDLAEMAKPAAEAEFVDPTVKALQDELAQIKAAMQGQQQSAVESRVQAAMSQFEAFAAEKDAAGAPKHPYFDEALPDMVRFAKAERADGRTPPPVSELYETACWANPTIRAKLVAGEEARKQQETLQKAKAQADAARRAGSSVSGASRPNGSHQPDRSLREELEAAISAHS